MYNTEYRVQNICCIWDFDESGGRGRRFLKLKSSKINLIILSVRHHPCCWRRSLSFLNITECMAHTILFEHHLCYNFRGNVIWKYVILVFHVIVYIYLWCSKHVRLISNIQRFSRHHHSLRAANNTAVPTEIIGIDVVRKSMWPHQHRLEEVEKNSREKRKTNFIMYIWDPEGRLRLTQ